jgi:hypothetical protein
VTVIVITVLAVSGPNNALGVPFVRPHISSDSFPPKGCADYELPYIPHSLS